MKSEENVIAYEEKKKSPLNSRTFRKGFFYEIFGVMLIKDKLKFGTNMKQQMTQPILCHGVRSVLMPFTSKKIFLT